MTPIFVKEELGGTRLCRGCTRKVNTCIAENGHLMCTVSVRAIFGIQALIEFESYRIGEQYELRVKHMMKLIYFNWLLSTIGESIQGVYSSQRSSGTHPLTGL